MPVLKGAGQWNPWSSIGSGLGGLTTMLANYYGNKDGDEVPIPKGLSDKDINQALPPIPEMDPNIIKGAMPPAPGPAPAPPPAATSFSPFTLPPLGSPGPVPLGGRRPPQPGTLSLDQILAMFGISGGGGRTIG